jgi:SNF2 family DNA or RNA helicase
MTMQSGSWLERREAKYALFIDGDSGFMNTAYHAKLFANQILLQSGVDNPARISRALNDACVDLNPHQVEAALFALKNPLSNGVILADEVGLGKTIEAGLVIGQNWAEGKRSILIIAPKSLRHQWREELDRLFGLSSSVLDGQSYRRAKKSGEDPLNVNAKIIITNEHFVDSNSQDIKKTKWDLVVIDEAHKLRNVWRKSKSEAKRAKAIREALTPFKKLLLTATPMQNNLMELFGLVTFIDDHILGTPESFQNTFCNVPEEIRPDRLLELRHRVSRFFHRELRKNVREYIQYTNRNSVTFTYTPTDDEETLRVSFEDYLRRPYVIAIPASAMPLLKLIYLKLLASSTFAIKNSLINLYRRLVLTAVQMDDRNLYDKLVADIRNKLALPNGRKSDELELFDARLFAGVILKSYEGLREAHKTIEEEVELTDEESEVNELYIDADSLNEQVEEDAKSNEDEKAPRKLFEPEEVKEEAQAILGFIELSRNISDNKKADALKLALAQQFEKAKSEGWPEKAVIFTEFRSTQNYIIRALSEIGLTLDEHVVIFNGDSGDAEERKRRVDEFKTSKKIFLTTEAGSEGLNLQFCNLILNYDLPWNPQRIEQRIGRCHRYGQKLDVIVANFVNTKNSADVRVLELLQEKFNLFRGAFGASDEVLGTIESGQDFEKEILKIYMACRSESEIQSAFDELKRKIGPELDRRLNETRKTVLETFDEEVQSKLKLTLNQTKDVLNELGQKLKAVLDCELKSQIKWEEDGLTFNLQDRVGEYIQGRYSLNTRDSTAIPVRTSSGIGESLLKGAVSKSLPSALLKFDLKSRISPISLIQNLDGEFGILTVGKLKSKSFGFEERIIIAGVDSKGQALGQEIFEKLFKFDAKIENGAGEASGQQTLAGLVKKSIESNVGEIKVANQTIFESEVDRLDSWAEDIKLSLELEIKSTDREIRQKKVDAKKAQLLEDKLELQKQIKNLEAKRNEKRRQLFESQDQIEREKDQLLEKIEKNLEPQIEFEELFTVNWKVS